MQKFTTLTATVAPLPIVNVDTDMILPKQFLKTVKRTGLGVNLFDEMRYDARGEEIPTFVLNRDTYRNSEILVSGNNFGCGSSREHAPWALLDFGIKCIIAPSFADIFFNNASKNGILLIQLPEEQVDILMQYAETGQALSIDLERQEISGEGIEPISFDIDPFKKKCLLNGLDDISLTLEKSDYIDAFEAKQKKEQSWLWNC